MPRGSEHPPTLDRRQFLSRGALVGTAAVLGPLAAGCGSAPKRSLPPKTATSATAVTTNHKPPDWSALGAALSGRLVLPTSPSYQVDKQLYNERFDNISPAAIAFCADPVDVQRCVDAARTLGVAVAARSGGHSYGGYSTCGGLVIDVTEMSQVTVAPDRQSAVVGAGARLIDVYNTLGQAGVLLPGGSCPTVGIAGLSLGGGIGVFGRNYGLTCDHLTSIDIVTADGRVVTASHDVNPDLFWASQGGGGGNFGVATSFTFRVDPIPDIALFTLVWPWAAATDVLGAWQQWVPGTPDELWSNCQLLSSGTAGGGAPLTVRVTGVFCGSTTTLSGLVGQLQSAVGTSPTYRFVGPEDYLHAMLVEAGCDGSTVAECHLPSQNPAGTLSRSSFVAKSAYVNDPLPAAGLEAVVQATQALEATVPAVGGGFVFDSYGGAINAVDPDATAFVHRRALCGIQYSFSYGTGASPSTVDAGTAWLGDAQKSLVPYVDGAYQNYIDPTLTDWPAAYYGANLARLVRIKSDVDPDDFFHFAQSVPTTLPV